MSSVTVKLEGVSELIKELKKVDDKYKTKSLKRVLRAASNPVMKRMRALSPVGKRDQTGTYGHTNKDAPHTKGNLKRSIGKKFNKDKNNPVIYVGPDRRKGIDAFYAHIVIGGSDAHKVPKKRGVVKFVSKTGKNVTVGQFNHPGHKGNDFVSKAYQQTRATTMKIMKEKSIVEIKKIWKSRQPAKQTKG